MRGTARLEILVGIFVLREFHFTLVWAEYDNTVGWITLEDVLKELVVPIEDEFDQEDRSPAGWARILENSTVSCLH